MASKLTETYAGNNERHKLARDFAIGAELVVRLFLMAAQKQLPPK